jgi:hypothetical protein
MVGDEARRSVRSFLADPANAELLRQVEARLGLAKAAIEDAYARYALESLSSSNDIYDDVGIHFAMWIEYQAPRSLHARRQQVVLDALQRSRPASIADIGFGAPTRYLRDHVLTTPSVKAHLFDKYPGALEVGRTILAYWNERYAARVELALHDMDVDPPVGRFDCYLMLDAIEHAAEPDRYLRDTVAAAGRGALFLFHLPIGPQIASHNMAWDSERAVTQWLTAAGLEAGRTEFILPNPAVDHFSRHGVALANLFVVAHKA